MRPFVKLDIGQMRAALPCLTGEELKIWLVYRLRANRDDVAWPGLELICKDAGVSRARASAYRKRLLAKGWLEQVGNERGIRGTFGSPRFRVCIPDHDSKMRRGENAARQKHDTAKINSTVPQKRDAPRLGNESRSIFSEVEPKKASSDGASLRCAPAPGQVPEKLCKRAFELCRDDCGPQVRSVEAIFHKQFSKYARAAILERHKHLLDSAPSHALEPNLVFVSLNGKQTTVDKELAERWISDGVAEEWHGESIERVRIREEEGITRTNAEIAKLEALLKQLPEDAS